MEASVYMYVGLGSIKCPCLLLATLKYSGPKVSIATPLLGRPLYTAHNSKQPHTPSVRLPTLVCSIAVLHCTTRLYKILVLLRK